MAPGGFGHLGVGLPLSRAIEDLVLLLECSTERDVENQVVFIPL